MSVDDHLGKCLPRWTRCGAICHFYVARFYFARNLCVQRRASNVCRTGTGGDLLDHLGHYKTVEDDRVGEGFFFTTSQLFNR